MTNPHWTAYVTTIVLPIIAIIGAWIAFQQMDIARNKLKLDLFEKRIAVYQIVRDTLSIAISKRKLTREDEIKYLAGTRNAQWLFGPEVFQYIEKLWDTLVDLELHNSMSESHINDDERVKHIHARANKIKWLRKQYSEFDKICSDYLHLNDRFKEIKLCHKLNLYNFLLSVKSSLSRRN